jgi:thiol-disulfide isomerase/thioredoxin
MHSTKHGRLTFGLGLAAVTAAALAWAQGTPYLAIGETAPAISGTGTDGKAYNAPAKDKPVFVVFWKERCPHNPRAAALFNALHEAYKGKVNFFGVVNAGDAGAKAWVDQFSLNYALLPDQINPDGKIAKVFEGYGSEAMQQLNEALAAAAGTKPAEVDLSKAPGRLTWG